MPITCHSSTSAASENGSPHCCMAIGGVAAISRFITPSSRAPVAAATMNTGCFMICEWPALLPNLFEAAPAGT
ncbi:MAG: hypothetical protein U1E71_05470 [Ramlibacter sp.]